MTAPRVGVPAAADVLITAAIVAVNVSAALLALDLRGRCTVDRPLGLRCGYPWPDRRANGAPSAARTCPGHERSASATASDGTAWWLRALRSD